jgi:adenosylcobinamide-GDP ribazoletransferase
MHVLKSLVIAFSIYSKIPVPQFEWKDEDMKYMLCFFPWIGAVIGVCVYLWYYVSKMCNIGQICYTLIGVAIPLIITGGFHVDGFMDTMDAFHSYQSKEKKLEILKDSHIGAFSVIMLALYGLIYIGAFSEINVAVSLKVVCAGFVLSRCLSGLAIVYFPLAKKDGMLYTFANGSQKNILKWSLILQSIICGCFILYQSILIGAFSLFTIGQKKS